jgi:hypothetical protein
LGTLLLAIVMLTDRVTNGTARPGMTWILNQPDHTEDTNQAAIAVIQMLALMFAFHPVKPRLWNFLLPVAALTVVVLTQSRNGLLAMVAFLGLSMRRIRVRHVLAGVGALALGAVLAPHDFWDRMAKTVTMTRGSSEVYGWMVRVYGYVSNVKLFMHNWLFGVGYLAGRAMSAQYNDLGVPLGAENFFLETGVGMGVIGLAVLWLCFARMFQLGQVVREVSPAGSLGHRLALVNMPFLVTVVIACLTQDCLIGVVAHAEMVIWFVLLIRAGHVSLRSAPAAVVAPAESGSGAGGVA